jgi:dihydrofolate reductase
LPYKKWSTRIARRLARAEQTTRIRIARDEPATCASSPTPSTRSRPNTRICRDDLVTEVGRLKGDSDVPLRTIGSLSVARQLLSAGLVDRLRLMTFPLLVGASGRDAAFAEAPSADLELADHRALDGRCCYWYRPTDRDIPQS